MALQICPTCKESSFTWSIGEGDLNTIWTCYKCRYTAYEVESFERVCELCKNKTEIRLKDEVKIYWWCNRCNSVNIIRDKHA